ncbi:hypothetical protein [Desulfotruncus alcoholivorax]|uniref:hypothetical protein n=1 Tax=Desulfotruncus alcoholivorax TaxID=265477 RepID=UPI00047F50FF|nr:hypothetical protein [Desulfotruncus alcoholivorax]
MELIKNYESIYYCNQLIRVVGRRYNIRPDLSEEVEPEIKGYVYEETMAGFFRTWTLNEMHLELIKIVNEMLVAEESQIQRKMGGLSEVEFKKILDECVTMGLLCENNISFKDEKNINLYLVDTGGIFAFKEAGIHYNKVKYTLSFDQRLKIYRKNIFLLENYKNKESIKLYLFEEQIGMPQDKKYQEATFLIDMKIAEKLGLTGQVIEAINDIVIRYNAKVYDTGDKKYIDIK